MRWALLTAPTGRLSRESMIVAQQLPDEPDRFEVQEWEPAMGGDWAGERAETASESDLEGYAGTMAAGWRWAVGRRHVRGRNDVSRDALGTICPVDHSGSWGNHKAIAAVEPRCSIRGPMPCLIGSPRSRHRIGIARFEVDAIACVSMWLPTRATSPVEARIADELDPKSPERFAEVGMKHHVVGGGVLRREFGGPLTDHRSLAASRLD